MSLWMFLKTVGDLCLYFSVLSAFPGLFPHETAFIWTVMLCAFGVMLSAGLTVWCPGRWNLLALIICAAPFSLSSSLPEALMILPAVIYSGAVILRRQMSVEYADFRTFFVRGAIAWAAGFTILCLLCWLEEVLEMPPSTVDSLYPLQYGLLWAVASVALLRLVRLGADGGESGLHMNRVQNLVLIGGMGVLMLAAVAVQMYWQELGEDIKKLFLEGAAYLMTPVFWLAKVIFDALPKYDKGFETAVTVETVLGTGAAGQPMATAEPVPPPVYEADPKNFWWLAVLIVLLMTAVLVIMVRNYAHRRMILEIREDTQTSELPGKKKRRSKRSYRLRVRQQYRDFLKYQNVHGVRLHPDQTSQDILENISFDTNAEGAAQLRQVYLRARYDTAHPVTRKDLEEAKTALKKSRS